MQLSVLFLLALFLLAAPLSSQCHAFACQHGHHWLLVTFLAAVLLLQLQSLCYCRCNLHCALRNNAVSLPHPGCLPAVLL